LPTLIDTVITQMVKQQAAWNNSDLPEKLRIMQQYALEQFQKASQAAVNAQDMAGYGAMPKQTYIQTALQAAAAAAAIETALAKKPEPSQP
jgi:hypothetical protein